LFFIDNHLVLDFKGDIIVKCWLIVYQSYQQFLSSISYLQLVLPVHEAVVSAVDDGKNGM